MERRWIAKNVDLELLTNSIVDFLKMMDFEIVKGETTSGYAIFAGNSQHFQIDGYVSVVVQGKPEDFTVELELHGRERKGERFLSPLLMTMFGGGLLLSKRFKSEDAWLKLKREFWRYLENILVQLTNSSNPSADQ